jgi:hypothetical protein
MSAPTRLPAFAAAATATNAHTSTHAFAARQIKLAISYALAQSTKLSLHERRVTDMVVETKHLPESLAACGKVAMSPETIAKLIGKVCDGGGAWVCERTRAHGLLLALPHAGTGAWGS